MTSESQLKGIAKQSCKSSNKGDVDDVDKKKKMFPVKTNKHTTTNKNNNKFPPKLYFLNSVNYRRSSGWNSVSHWLKEKKVKDNQISGAKERQSLTVKLCDCYLERDI